MINIRLTFGYWLKLRRQLGITISMANLLFQEEVEYGEFVNSIPFEAKEINAVNFFNFHSEHDFFPSFLFAFDNTAEIFKDTVKIAEGKFSFRETTNKDVNLDIVSGISALPFMKYKLAEIFTGIEFTAPTPDDLIAHAAAQNLDFYPNVNYVFPQIKNEDFYGTSQPLYKGYLNRWDPVAQTFFVNPKSFIYSPIYTSIYSNFDALSPQPFLKYILKTAFGNYGYTLDGDFINDVDQDQLLLFNNNALDEFVDATGYMAVAFLDQFFLAGGGLVIITIPQIDHFDMHTATGARIKNAGGHFIKFQFELYGYSSDVFRKQVWVGGVLWYDAVFDETNPAEWIIEYYFDAAIGHIGQLIQIKIVNTGTTFSTRGYWDPSTSTATIPEPTFLQIDVPTPDAGYNRYSPYVRLGKHLPDITVGELLLKLKNSLGLSIDYDPNKSVIEFNYIKKKNERPYVQDISQHASHSYQKKLVEDRINTVSFEFPEDDGLTPLIKSELPLNYEGAFLCKDNFTPPTVEGRYYLAQNTSILYITFLNTVTTTLEFRADSYYFPLLNYGFRDKTDYKVPCTPVMTTVLNYTGWADSLMPYVKMQGNESFETVRLLYWKGMVNNKIGQTYPMAGNGRLDTQGNDLGGYNIRLEGANGMEANFWGKWFHMINQGIIWYRNFKLNISEYLYFRVFNKFRCRQREFIPKTAEMNVESNKKIIEADLEYIEVLI